MAGKRISEILEEHETLLKGVGKLSVIIEKASRMIVNTIANGNKVLICGNGGSAADSQHIAAEFVNKFLKERTPLPAIALTTDTSIITSISNDFTFDDIFSKQIEAIGKKGDVLIAISTSCKSKNILNAIKIAKKKGIKTIGLSGNNTMGCDINIAVPSNKTPRVQEIHMLIYHILCELVEYEFSKSSVFG